MTNTSTKESAVKTTTARELRRGINYGTNWANSMLTAGGNKMLQELLMQNLITWSRRGSRAANAGACRSIRNTRIRFQAARTR